MPKEPVLDLHPGTITAVVTLAAVLTPDGFPVTGNRRCGDRRSGHICGFASRYWAGVASRAEHAGHGHPLHGAHCGLHGNAVRADRPEGVLAHLEPGLAGAAAN
jgi:hypothetical protein